MLAYKVHQTFIPDQFGPLFYFILFLHRQALFAAVDSSLLSPGMEVPGDISVNVLSASIISPIHIVQEQPYLLIMTSTNYPHEYNTYFICLLLHVLSIFSYQAESIALSSVILLLILAGSKVLPIPRTKISNPAESEMQNSKA